MKEINIPQKVKTNCEQSEAGRRWISSLAMSVKLVADEWDLTLTEMLTEGATASWVSRCQRKDGTSAVLKLGMPHMEAEHEIEGLQFWDGDPTVRLLESNKNLNAMLLEACEPGTPLKALETTEQDRVIAKALRRLWKDAPADSKIRPLSLMINFWVESASKRKDQCTDQGLFDEGARRLKELSLEPTKKKMIATDLHAGNVLRAKRDPWLVIDPKPFIGDPAYDVTQHLLNCRDRLSSCPRSTIQGLADLVELDWKRIRDWTFARLAMSGSVEDQALARALLQET